MIELSAGQIYRTEEPQDACKILKGSLDVFVVPTEKGVRGRPMFLAHINEGMTIPAVAYQDPDHIGWNLQLEASEDSRIRIVEDASTKPLKKRFAREVGLDWDYQKTGFEEALRQQYLTREIRDDVLITRSEVQREKDRKDTEDIIRQTEKGLGDHQQEGTGTAAGSRYPKAASINRYIPRCIFLAILTATPAVCAVAYMAMEGSLLMIFFWLLMTIATHWMASVGIRRMAEDEARSIQYRFFDRLYGRDGDDGEGYASSGSSSEDDEGRLAASRAVTGFEDARRSISCALEAAVRLMTAALILVCVAFLFHAPALVTAAGAVISAGLLYAGTLASARGQRVVRSLRDKAGMELLGILYRIEKIRLSGSTEHMIKRYYSCKRDEKATDHMRKRSLILSRGAAAVVALLCIPAVILSMGLTGSLGLLEESACLIGCSMVLYECIRGAALMAGGRIPAASEPEAPEGSGAAEAAEEGKAPEAPGSDIPKFYSDLDEGREVIELDNISFDYGEGPVLKNITLKIRKGESLGLVGTSGSGKSTLLKILAGREKPVEGKVRFLGRDIGGSERSGIEAISGIVLQDDRLLTESIRENILMGSGYADRKAFDRAVRDSGLEDELEYLPMGYETIIREDGENISAGQKQKILLSRALIKEPQILFLDEAESESGREERNRYREALERRNITIVSVSHHYSTIGKCDKIAVMEDGRIVEYGHPESLIDNKGKFYSLMHRQM